MAMVTSLAPRRSLYFSAFLSSSPPIVPITNILSHIQTVTKWYLDHTLTTVAPVCTIYLLSLGAATLVALPYLALNPSLSKGGSTAGAQETGRYFNKYAVLALDFVLMALWFAGFVSLAVFQHKLILCGGRVCQIMAGGSAVGAITWYVPFVACCIPCIHT